jgi:hypothetical protein
VSEEDKSVSRKSYDGRLSSGPKSKNARHAKAADRGKLRIGDDWNAIRIIALSQSNPLKAIAEFVENSIDAHAKTVTITRGRDSRGHYLSIKDDGDGVPRDEEGRPNFKYVATHICDSIKRRLKAEGSGTGLQGEFGIGLLSFWTVGDQLTMISSGSDERSYQMTMSKGDSGYTVSSRRVLFAEPGTELRISPLLEGIRILSGEKIQWYLASELRDRIRTAKVRVTVIDKLARKQYEVEPRALRGSLAASVARSSHAVRRCVCRAVSRGARRQLSGNADSHGDPSHRGPRHSSRAGARALVFQISAGANRRAVPEPDTRHSQRHHSR